MWDLRSCTRDGMCILYTGRQILNHWTTSVYACSISQSCLTLCDPIEEPSRLLCGIFQARILEWVAVFSSRGSSWPRAQNPNHLHWQADSLPLSHQGSPWTTRKVPKCIILIQWILEVGIQESNKFPKDTSAYGPGTSLGQKASSSSLVIGETRMPFWGAENSNEKEAGKRTLFWHQ